MAMLNNQRVVWLWYVNVCCFWEWLHRGAKRHGGDGGNQFVNRTRLLRRAHKKRGSLIYTLYTYIYIYKYVSICIYIYIHLKIMSNSESQFSWYPLSSPQFGPFNDNQRCLNKWKPRQKPTANNSHSPSCDKNLRRSTISFTFALLVPAVGRV